MSTQVFPTKGNLISTKKSLALATMGYDLMDRKRNILIREMMTLVDTAKQIRGEIETTYGKAYRALMRANVTLGLCSNIADSIPEETGVEIAYRSVMGVEIPHVTLDSPPPAMSYGFSQTNSLLDYAYICFDKVKRLTVTLAEIFHRKTPAGNACPNRCFSVIGLFYSSTILARYIPCFFRISAT